MRDAAESYGTPSSATDSHRYEETVALLDKALGEDTFRRYDGVRHLGAFSIACFEFVTAGVAANFSLWRDDASGLRERVRSIWSATEFRDNSGTGVSARRRVPRLITDARDYFSRH